MSEILARLRVRETHGIRRFLYPLAAIVSLPDEVEETRLTLTTEARQAVPLQVTRTGGNQVRLDFALSLDLRETQDLMLLQGEPAAPVDDRLNISYRDNNLVSTQQRLCTVIDLSSGAIREVVYDGVRHLRGEESRITRNGVAVASTSIPVSRPSEEAALSASLDVRQTYPDGGTGETETQITACKSWATVTHRTSSPKPNDEFVFTLPLAVTAPTLTCDFGVGGGIYGKLQAETADEVVWQTEFGDGPWARWSVSTSGRVDYIGEAATAAQFLPQQWFHVIDRDKSLAVAITHVPATCRVMTVTLRSTGDVTVAFRLGDVVSEAAEFGVCYHFLNDVPAIAAATNPQSILLPPAVEVLPV